MVEHVEMTFIKDVKVTHLSDEGVLRVAPLGAIDIQHGEIVIRPSRGYLCIWGVSHFPLRAWSCENPAWSIPALWGYEVNGHMTTAWKIMNTIKK